MPDRHGPRGAGRQAFVAMARHANPLGRFGRRRRNLALRPTLDFLKTEAAGGAALIGAAVLALLAANSPFAADYFNLIGAPFTITLGQFSETLSAREWVAQGLMSIFFFVVGLEIKQELLKGEFSSPRKLALPLVGAIGGMVIPALVYLAINLG